MTSRSDQLATQQYPVSYITQPSGQQSLTSSLHDSTHSLSSSRYQASQVAKTYRQAANLFLTRRFPEALSTIEPIITPESHSSDPDNHINGNGSGSNQQQQDTAPIAFAARGTRIKVWSFWLTFLHQVIDLGQEEGKLAFGTNQWKALVSKAQTGSVWEDVVRDGYGGIEGSVDAEVVVSLATLLLTHMPTQKLNQERLEAYLSAVARPSFDITSHLTQQTRSRRQTSGTNTPRDLQTSLKILELYTLHVLPRNGEWNYAKEFIMMSELLDEERKEAFLQALAGLQEEKEQAAVREKEIQRAQAEQLERQRKEEEDERVAEAKRAADEARKREEAKKRQQQQGETGGQQGKEVAASNNRSKVTHNRGVSGSTASQPRPAAKKDALGRKPPASLFTRMSYFFANMQTLLFSMSHDLRTNPMLALRTALFVLALSLAFGRREIRERIQRILSRIWLKLRATIGMGVKVTSI